MLSSGMQRSKMYSFVHKEDERTDYQFEQFQLSSAYKWTPWR